MEQIKVETSNISSNHEVICEEKDRSLDSESCEFQESINPPGLLDLVHVEEGKNSEKNLCENYQDTLISDGTILLEEQDCTIIKEEDDSEENYQDTLISDGTILLEEQDCTITKEEDYSEEEELEPVAAVEVLPVREEDFLPEVLTLETAVSVQNSSRKSRLSNAVVGQPWNFQEDPLQDPGKAYQHPLEIPHDLWGQNFFLGAQPTHLLTLENTNNNQSLQNQLTTIEPHSSENLSSQPSKKTLLRRECYNRFRQKYPELLRIRNREYSRRYRFTHPDRVREQRRRWNLKRVSSEGIMIKKSIVREMDLLF